MSLSLGRSFFGQSLMAAATECEVMSPITYPSDKICTLPVAINKYEHSKKWGYSFKSIIFQYLLLTDTIWHMPCMIRGEYKHSPHQAAILLQKGSGGLA
jgi:hypothetical protein